MEKQGEYKIKANVKDKQLEIINHYGTDKQLDQLIEECGELIVAIAKTKRYPFSDTCIDKYENLIEEMADVKNLIEQIEIENSWIKEGVKRNIEYKVNREIERIGRR